MSSTSASVLTLTVLFTIIALASACSLVKEPSPPHTMKELLYAAPIVIYGKDIGHAEWTEDSNFGSVFFEVYCIFKDSTDSIKNSPHNISLDGEYLYHSCMHTNTEVGNEYIIALKSAGKDRFAPWEPSIMNVANYPPTQENLEAVLGLCGLQDVTETGLKSNSCPKASVIEGCKEAIYSGVECLQSSVFVVGLVVMVGRILELTYTRPVLE